MMTKDDKQQHQLPFGAAQGSFDERRLKVGMTIGAMYDSKTEALRETYTGAPVMELRVLMLLMLDEEARGRLLTPEEMIKPPWGLLCSERTVRRVLRFGADLGILQSDKRLDTGQQKFTKVWRIDWGEINRFITSHSPGQIGKSPGQIGKSPGQIGKSDQPRTSSSFFFVNTKDVDDVVLEIGKGTDWPNGQEGSTGHDRDAIGEPESVNESPHEGPRAAVRPVSGASHRAATSDLSSLVGLVRQCSVYAAERAVQTAIGHGHDIPALVAGWRRFCRPACDEAYAAKRLFYRLIDPPMGLEPHQGWIVQYPHRIKSLESEQAEAIKRKREADEAAEREAQQRRCQKAKAWILSIEATEQEPILEEYRLDVTEFEAECSRKATKPLEAWGFLCWLADRNGVTDE